MKKEQSETQSKESEASTQIPPHIVACQSLDGDVYTELVVIDGRPFMRVYSEEGELLDVLERS